MTDPSSPFSISDALTPAFPIYPIPPPVPSVPVFKPLTPKPTALSSLADTEGLQAIKGVIDLLRGMQNTIDSTFVKLSTAEAQTLCFMLKTLTERSARLMETLVTTNIVIAGDHAQYKDWCETRHRDPGEYIYISKPSQLSGMHFVRLECIGTWYDRHDILEIMQALAQVNQV